MRKIITVGLVTLSLWLGQPAFAETGNDTAKATITAPSMTRSTYQDWQSLCVQQDAETLCDISQTLQVERENGQTVTALRATVTKRDGVFVMELAFRPFGQEQAVVIEVSLLGFTSAMAELDG